jgi:hypothetical protein
MEDTRELPVLASAYLYCGDLTFDMSGGPKAAKQALGRPLDGGVRALVEYRHWDSWTKHIGDACLG